jgi:hypothetical protein
MAVLVESLLLGLGEWLLHVSGECELKATVAKLPRTLNVSLI